MDATSPAVVTYYTVREIADLCRVHPVTVRKWVACGVVQVVRVGPAGRIRIPVEEIPRIIGTDPTPK